MMITCRSCRAMQTLADIIEAGQACAYCNRPICRVCGCTESSGCDSGCGWLIVGVCTTHAEPLVRGVRAHFGRQAMEGARRYALARIEVARAQVALTGLSLP